MSQLAEQISKSKGLLSAVDGITNGRAFITLLATLVATGLLSGVFSYFTVSLLMNGHDGMSKLVGLVGFLLSVSVLLIGTNATGFLLNDVSRRREQRTISDALMVAAATLPRVLGVLALVLAIGILVLVAVALALFLCKIPGIGPLLYTFVFPACVILLGVSFYAGLFVVALHGPAIWEGNPAMRTIAILGAIVRHRLLSVVIQVVLLSLLVILVTGIIFGALGLGMATTGSLSIPILGQGGGLGMLGGLMGGMGGEGGGYAVAAGFGGMLLMGSAIVAPCLLAITGNCIIFANVTENLSTTEVESSIQGALDSAREKADQAKRQLDESRRQLVAAAAPAAPQSPPPSAPQVKACPQCHGPIADADIFCGNCGHRLG